MKRRPIGISAMGIAAPLGVGKRAVAQNLFAGTRAGLVARDDLVPGKSVRVGVVAGELPALTTPALTRNDRLMQAALAEITSEIEAAAELYGRHRVAVILGTSTSGIAEGEAAFASRRATGMWPRDFDYRQQELSSLTASAAQAMHITGPAYVIATACSSSAKVFATARRLLEAGICDAAVVGGADSICRTTVNGFRSLEALSRDLCNPFSKNRDGINVGEAAAAFLLTREEAPVSLLGIGETSDAYHMNAPEPGGKGALAAMRVALADADLAPSDMAYINLHGTGTVLNDSMEAVAIANLFGTDTPCSSTKGMTGHTLGAAGACEAAFLWLSLHPDYATGSLPPHVWDGVSDSALPPIRLVDSRDTVLLDRPMAMMSNSFAFGGSNVAIILGRGAPA